MPIQRVSSLIFYVSMAWLLVFSWIFCNSEEVDVGVTGDSALNAKFTFHSNISDAADFTNYFETYGTVYEQKRMLEDNVRMRSYHAAITGNADYFKGKVVLDVGAGTGILSMWAAQAGAKKVGSFTYIHWFSLISLNLSCSLNYLPLLYYYLLLLLTFFCSFIYPFIYSFILLLIYLFHCSIIFFFPSILPVCQSVKLSFFPF